MRFLHCICLGFVALVAASGAGCAKEKPKEGAPVPERATAQPPPQTVPAASTVAAPKPLVSSFSVAEAENERQLVDGFYPLEHGRWRWTQKQFGVELAPPAGPKEKGLLLRFKLNMPEAALKAYKTVTLSAKVDGTELKPKKLSKNGDHEYTADLPASVVEKQKLRVDFTLDKSFTPEGDARELGLIAHSFAVEPK
jgi:hypothetical protein